MPTKETCREIAKGDAEEKEGDFEAKQVLLGTDRSRSAVKNDAQILSELAKSLPENLYQRAIHRLAAKIPEISREIQENVAEILLGVSWMFTKKTGDPEILEKIDKEQDAEISQCYLQFCARILMLRAENLLKKEMEKFILASSESLNLTPNMEILNFQWNRDGDSGRKTFGAALSRLGVALSLALVFQLGGPASFLWGLASLTWNWKSLVSPRWELVDIEREAVRSFTETLQTVEAISEISESFARTLAEVFRHEIPEELMERQVALLSSSQREFSASTDFSTWRIAEVKYEIPPDIDSGAPVIFLFEVISAGEKIISRHRFSECRNLYTFLVAQFPERAEPMNCFPRRTMFKSRELGFIRSRCEVS
jgi:hypothetical protein